MIPASEDARYLRITADIAYLRRDLTALAARIDQLETTAREAIELIQGRICELEELLRPQLNKLEDPHDG